MGNNNINILGVNISILNKSQVLEKIESFLEDGPPRMYGEARAQHQIITPNPEFILNAREDEEFFYILNNADLAIPDGVGLKFAGWAMGKNLHRITGADLIKDILKIAEEKNNKVVILNWNMGLSDKETIGHSLEKKYPNLKFLVLDIDREFTLLNKEVINNFKPDILFCTLGAPWQEKFIFHNLKKLPSVKVAIGVGGAFDFLTGKLKRAPKLMRALALEWLWRLILEPRYRFKRIYNAVIVFPLLFIKWRFILPFFYRSNVVCMMYKQEQGNYKILLVERMIKKNHWQLPQGGIDGENVKKAGARELKEEVGTDKFKIQKTYKNLWKYKFGNELSKFKVSSRMVWGYNGQKQGLVITEFMGEDKDIKINFWDHSNWKWVDAKNLINEVHPVRKEANKVFLNKFNKYIKKHET